MDEFAMPGQERGTAVDVCRLVDFVLLKPVGNVAGRKVCSEARKKTLVQRDDRVPELVSLQL